MNNLHNLLYNDLSVRAIPSLFTIPIRHGFLISALFGRSRQSKLDHCCRPKEKIPADIGTKASKSPAWLEFFRSYLYSP